MTTSRRSQRLFDLSYVEFFEVDEFHEGRITKRKLIFLELTDSFMEECPPIRRCNFLYGNGQYDRFQENDCPVHAVFFKQMAAQTTSTIPSTKKMLLRATNPQMYHSRAIQSIRIMPQAKQAG